jgi:NAD(P)-dependent dehydrogenase (short-subunit alcohol dehydrogenase family)
MQVVLADIEQAALDDAVARLAARGAGVLGVQTDVADPASVERLAAAATDAFGPVHLLMNNAGVGYTGRAWRIKLEDWQWVMGVCFWGAVHGVRSFVPAMIEHGDEAHVVNTSSWHGFGAAPRGAPYQAAKQAVTALTESLYFDLQESAPQVGVSLLCPGYTNTRITESLRNHPDEEVRRKVAGSGREQSGWASPESVADLVVDAVENRHFYVLADAPTWLPILQQRFAAVVEQRDPVPLQLPRA